MVHSKTYTAICEVPTGRKMEYVLYKITSPSGRTYIGITNNLKRRLKEHKTSPYPFGHAVRKYGYENMHFEFEHFKDVGSALAREAELVTPTEVASRKYYNASVGGALSNVLSQDNPMHRESVVRDHPNIWTTHNNPMNNPDSKARMIKSQSCKKVSVDGVVYYGVREAARKTGQSRQNVLNRLRSKNFPTWYYL
jgi:predicted GIY-YIG superfamily endonuclease